MGLLNVGLGAVDQGLIWGFLALGVYITFRLLDIADLTVDGSFATGGAVCAVSILAGIHPLVALLLSILAGFVAGGVTGLLHTRCKIPAILAGILTQIGLYSINLRIMSERSNLPLAMANTLFADVALELNMNRYVVVLLITLVFVVIFILLTYWFFGTEIGSALRATGNSEQMATSLGVNTDNMKLLGLMISNGLVGLSGGLLALYNKSADVKMGTGAIVFALASIVIGEIIIPNKKGSFMKALISVMVGSVVYRLLITIALQVGLNTNDLNLVTAIITAILLTTPIVMAKRRQVALYKKQTGKVD